MCPLFSVLIAKFYISKSNRLGQSRYHLHADSHSCLAISNTTNVYC